MVSWLVFLAYNEEAQSANFWPIKGKITWFIFVIEHFTEHTSVDRSQRCDWPPVERAAYGIMMCGID